MQISHFAARALLEELIDSEDAQVKQIVTGRLYQLGRDLQALKDLRDLFDQVEELYRNLGVDLDHWESLGAEFAALCSWLLSGLASTKSSDDFTLIINRNSLILADDLVTANPKKLVVAGWVIGIPGSSGKPYSGVMFPLKTLGVDNNIASAYAGLAEHIVLLDHLRRNNGVFDDPKSSYETEMLLTSIPIRVVGLSEALANFESGEEKKLLKALQEGINNIQRAWSSEQKADWTKRSEIMVQQRNAICHPYKRNPSEASIAEVIPAVSLDYVVSLGELGTYMMAGHLTNLLKEIGPERANSWFGSVSRAMERTKDQYSY
jgi:hypothetical protein